HLPADGVEVTADVDRARAHRQGPNVAVRARVPGGGGTRCRIQRGDPAARLPADAGEATADVDRAPAHHQGIDCCSDTWVGADHVRVPAGQAATGIQV